MVENFPKEIDSPVTKKQPVIKKEKKSAQNKGKINKPEKEAEVVCTFCDILKNKKYLIYEDEQVFAFYDKKKYTAKEHILVCPNIHLNDITDVEIEHVGLLEAMNTVGENILKNLFPSAEYRFGFHVPPQISQHHLHMHGLVLPITDDYYNGTRYGTQLYRINNLIEMLRKGKKLPKGK